MTSERFALVKTSGIGSLSGRHHKRSAASRFVRRVQGHPVVKTRPLRIARIQFLVGEFADFVTAPRLGSEAFKGAWPTAVGILESVGMQAGKEVGKRTPRANEVGLGHLLER